MPTVILFSGLIFVFLYYSINLNNKNPLFKEVILVINIFIL